MMQSREHQLSRNDQAIDFVFVPDLHMNKTYSTQAQPSSGLGFFAQIQQSIFGAPAQTGGASGQNGVQTNSNKTLYIEQSKNANGTIQAGRALIQIYLDLQFKSFSRQPLTDETTVSELLKNLKAKYTMNPSSVASGPQRKSAVPKGSSALASTPGRLSEISPQCQFKEDYGLFMVNVRAKNPILSIRKLSPNDLLYRVYVRSAEAFPDGEDRFKIIFAKFSDIEMYLKSKGASQSQFDEENHVVSQLGKSIINNKTYERKGKLSKKSLNSDKFKERQFVLDKDQLFYYKNEKQKDKNFNLIMLSNATIHILENYNKQKFCFQIENENRKYILSTKSQYDLDQWVFAIQGQIRLSKDNKNIADVNQSIILKEKEIAQHDMVLIQKIFKPKNIIFNPVQPVLLEFVNDPFINELLPHLTQYINLVREKEYQRQALEKAKDIVTQLRSFNKKVQKQLTSGSVSDSASMYSEESKESAMTPVVITESDVKRYKELKPEQKIQCLFSQDEFTMIEHHFSKMLSDSQDPNRQLLMDPKLFNCLLIKIQKILKYNFLESFYQEKKIELLSIPTVNYKMYLPKLEFNSIGSNVTVNPMKRQTPMVLGGGGGVGSSSGLGTVKNCNIIETLLVNMMKKKGMPEIDFTQFTATPTSQNRYLQTQIHDPNFMPRQVENFSMIQGISKVSSSMTADDPSKLGR